MTGRMITLTWNPPRGLDMAIGASGPTGLLGGDGVQSGSGRGTEGARLGGKAQMIVLVEGKHGTLGTWPGAAWPVSSSRWIKPWLCVRRGHEGAAHSLSRRDWVLGS